MLQDCYSAIMQSAIVAIAHANGTVIILILSDFDILMSSAVGLPAQHHVLYCIMYCWLTNFDWLGSYKACSSV